MARAAVRAKQAQRAQAQAAANASRKQRKHASGGNPNQDLFFARLRRRQKWVFLALAVIFAVSFAALGVGSGNGNGLQSMFNSILGNGGNPVGKAEGEIKTNPTKGYKDLADAYVTKGDLPKAIDALTTYTALTQGKKDWRAWQQLAGYESQQAGTYAGQYQQVLQSAAIQAPGSIFQPTGAAGAQLGTNPIDQYYSGQNQALSGPLYQKAITGYNSAVADYQSAAKYAPPGERASAEQLLAQAAQTAGNNKVAVQALQRYVDLSPNSPLLSQIEAQCKKLGGTCAPTHSKG
jgi:tetratricopeptide (TPR) repeat protein